MSTNGCKVEFKEHGLEVTGRCAEGLLNAFNGLYSASKEVVAEISAYACVNPKNGSVEKVILGKVGTPTATSLPIERACPVGYRQVSVHTHPTSGKARFSETDACTITDRMNRGFDDASCVVGKNETQCFMKALIPKRDDNTI